MMRAATRRTSKCKSLAEFEAALNQLQSDLESFLDEEHRINPILSVVMELSQLSQDLDIRVISNDTKANSHRLDMWGVALRRVQSALKPLSKTNLLYE